MTQTTPPTAREAVARLCALHGLGTLSGLDHRGPPNASWTQEEWERRVLECVPERVVEQCYALADAILALNLPASGEERLREALGDVLGWYQSDEHEARSLADILTDIAADLEHDRKLALMVPKLRLAGANLSVCAQTTGGTAGPDAGLMLAIRDWAEAEAPVRAALAQDRGR